ncbi:LacI family transcriptional regulator [Rhizobium sp. TRM96647]|uniref:LacI family DNA-binding transcriptional regulator n=1 Tax=unclassified Rhizobium TaxID=2613769 RepID=UPI0021E99350|nr:MULTISPECIES: LacI family DNA-binding transcriptional regulator [unclassified Rhizobium]MCV3738710.1 LacI family transcriptional regulator [Rhizobium sp. TRM96647]MCV3760397.1 LacI family transcriptional regulator [Rhizobium sp. TRM96650]
MDSSRKQRILPTIADVAELAGVSRAIASRALSRESRPVSADKRARVLEAAEKLGFKPNLLARSLTTKTVNLIAVIVNHIHDFSDLDLFDLLIGEIQSIGKQVIIVRVGTVERAEEFLRNGVAYHVDAALVFSDFADAETVRRMFRNDDVLMLNGMHDELSPSIVPDETIGIAQAVADAASKGVATAALVTGRLSSPVEQIRIAAFKTEMQRHGIELVAEFRGDYSYASGRHMAQLPDWPDVDAVFCSSDAMAMGVMDVHRDAFSQNQPRRFRLYGFDNLSLTDFEAYPISSIGYDKKVYVGEILRFLNSPDGLANDKSLVNVPTFFVPRATS